MFRLRIHLQIGKAAPAKAAIAPAAGPKVMSETVRAEMLDQVCADAIYRFPSLFRRMGNQIVVHRDARDWICARFFNRAGEWRRA